MSEKPIDPSVFAELQATTGPEFAAELMDTFVEEAPGMIAELRNARTEGDNERFQRAAHSLKSNANTFGAAMLAAQARKFELAGLDADSLRDEAALAELETVYENVAIALKALSNA
jgi:HPt (histidine-containing phosphotransfer) domain-containing protein